MAGSTEGDAGELKIDAFLEKMNEHADLDKCFEALTQSSSAVRISIDLLNALRLAMESSRKMKLLDCEDVAEIVVEVKKHRKNCSYIIKNGDELTCKEFEEIVKNGDNINCEEFRDIVKKLEARTVVSRLKEIGSAIKEKEASEHVVLYGPSGVGKTWMAKKVADHAVRSNHFDFAVWIYPERIYSGGFTRHESIAHQLFLTLDFQKDEAEAARHGIQKEKQKKLGEMIALAIVDKKILLICEELEVPNKWDLKRLFDTDEVKPENFMILVTKKNLGENEKGIEVKPWTWGEARAVVGVGQELRKKQLADFFISKSRRLPADILIIAKTMSCLGKDDSGLQKMESIRQRTEGEEDNNKITQMLITASDLIPKSILIDCYSSITSDAEDKHFLNKGKRGMVNLNELISYWIVEGHLGQFDCIQDAYDKGYQVVMDLLDCGLLRKLENSYVMSSGRMFSYDTLDYYNFFGEVRLGMGNTFDCKLGKIALADGIMRTVAGRQEEEKVQAGEKKFAGEEMVTLMLDGRYFELPGNSLFDKPGSELGYLMPQLEVLVVFNPTNKPFPLPIQKLKELRLLVLRGCKYLKNFDEIFSGPFPNTAGKSKTDNHSLSRSQSSPALLHSPMTLKVLEISGPSPLNMFPESFFSSLPELRSVNLSYLSMTSLPNSFYKLKKVEYLILKGTKLVVLEGLEKFTELQLLDVSDSEALYRFKQKSFRPNPKLEVINFSNTMIDRIPLIRSLKNLRTLTLSRCKDLRGIRKIDGLNKLQILNISGAKMVDELLDPIINQLYGIELFDVSGTSISRLPGRIGNPRFLHMRDCSNLCYLLPIASLSKIEVFDVSGSCNLGEIRDEFLKEMTSLRVLNLSKTGIERLPSLSSPLSLHRLWLSHCRSLTNLDSLRSMEELEELDISDCWSLDQLPSLEKLRKLKKFYVMDCPNLTALPDDIKVLEILDHSGTTLRAPPSCCSAVVKGPIASTLDGLDPQLLLRKLGATDYVQSISRPYEQLKADVQNQCNWQISGWKVQQNASPEMLIYSPGVHFLQLLEMNQPLKESLSKFHILLVPTDVRIELPQPSSYKDELRLRDFHFRHLLSTDTLQGCLEIRGFIRAPECAQPVLERAESIVLIDNPFLSCLSDTDHNSLECLRAMKVCWIERCNEMKHLIEGSIPADSLQNLQFLWFSHLMNMTKVSSDHSQGFSFKSLEGMYLEFCPNLSSICSSFSQFKVLKTLHIRYCKNLKTLSEETSPELVSLTELHLWGLPNLEGISLKSPCLKILRVGDCCLLEHVLSSVKRSYEHLEILQIKSCDNLKTICESPDEPISPKLRELELWALPKLQTVARSIPSLETLRVGECHSLETLVDRPGNLKNLEIKSCNKLRTIFQHDLPEEFDVKMELLCLPELKSIGANRSPFKATDKIWGCPKLKLDDAQGNDGRNP
ncbi:putative disease resistance protein At4g19050 [Andrographis paniculata]|uniref:putative disease resistance protein At4g19050 n=1 Tax=Andrographis paniculata TaxID=175694 RepID=UPI0021E98E75|nr:putative disease resistance protein At4g19050 [Andrographis paniculata]XP_051138705.1 putative disease resistance protein At4g19050 [Andrographis paniculata]XP_051138706.1 putative disease resistance protein At4g19050 [Andrographis paniculata]XP_051138707.1 putative disease resistance protein At4g19050 [Andrographis paniculata]